MTFAYVGLGSNIEPKEKYLMDAIRLLGEHKKIELTNKSAIYETEPVDYLEQDKFLNMVVEIKTSLTSSELLHFCQQIELRLGRDRSETQIEKGPRTIDLDILIFGKEITEIEVLQIPHPRIRERAFVLVPLYEIAPTLAVPGIGQKVEDLLQQLSEDAINEVVIWKKV